MDKKIFKGKTKEEAINNALIELEESRENIYVKEIETTKGGLFKSPKVEIEVTTKDDVINFIKEYLQKLIHDMGIGTNLEIKKREKNVTITILSDNNALLIGKQGRTMDALNTVLRQAIFARYGFYFSYVLDIGEYKEQKNQNLERVAKSVAREVARTKIEAKLDPMNSYERRIIHNALNDYKKVYTESEGTEPNRYVVIKPVLEENQEETLEEEA